MGWGLRFLECPGALLKARRTLNDGLLDFICSFETSLNWNDLPHHITTDRQPFLCLLFQPYT
jgi:hypothetical protein